MRELTVRLRFTSPCLGNVKRNYREHGKVRSYFLMPRNAQGRVVFMPSWWVAPLRHAADVLCRHQKDVKEIRFAQEVDGQAAAVPESLYRRYYGPEKFSRHEAFMPGEIISVTCLVPAAINDDDFLQLLQYAGRYFGISPAHSNKYGFYEVVSIRSAMPRVQAEELQNENSEANTLSIGQVENEQAATR